METCVAGQWRTCSAPRPEAEVCDGRDNDCDGRTDNASGGSAPLSRACSTACGGGQEHCEGGQWVGCTAPQPSAEQCGNGLDDNCDGRVDELCECRPGETQPCGVNRGVCRAGTKTCGANGRWSACQGEVAPTAELCDALDNDCDGRLDNGAVCGAGAACRCGGCANPCRSGECAGGLRCVSGYCVQDRCPLGTYCDGTNCLPGNAPAITDGGGGTTQEDGGSGSGTGSTGPDAGSAGGGTGADPGEGGGSGARGVPPGCNCSARPGGAGSFPLSVVPFLFAAFALIRRASRARHKG